MASVQEMERAREGVAILFNDVWHSTVMDFLCVSSIILWIKFKFSSVKICVVVGYGSNERNGEERDIFLFLEFQEKMIMEEEGQSSML